MSTSTTSSFKQVFKTRARLPNAANVKCGGGVMENLRIISAYKPLRQPRREKLVNANVPKSQLKKANNDAYNEMIKKGFRVKTQGAKDMF